MNAQDYCENNKQVEVITVNSKFAVKLVNKSCVRDKLVFNCLKL